MTIEKLKLLNPKYKRVPRKAKSFVPKNRQILKKNPDKPNFTVEVHVLVHFISEKKQILPVDIVLS